MQNDTLVGVDIAKEVFEVGVSDRPGHVARRRRLERCRFLEFFAQLPPATVVMEACGSAHYWARRIEELGHVVVLLPPQYVRPYVVRNKTDRKDVDGLLEAFRNERINPVPIKSVTQQVLGTLHRLRSGRLADRTRAINALRGLLRELGFFIPEGRSTSCPMPGRSSRTPRAACPTRSSRASARCVRRSFRSRRGSKRSKLNSRRSPSRSRSWLGCAPCRASDCS